MIPHPFLPRPRGGRPFAAAAAGLFMLVAPAGLHAQGAAPALPRNSGKEYVLAHPSSFNAPPSSARNPFWPIGWVPSAPVPVTAAVTVLNVKPEDFTVTTISMDYPPLAVVNGKTRGVGDRIPVGAEGQDAVMVKQILDGVVVLDYRGHELRVTNGGGPARKPPAK